MSSRRERIQAAAGYLVAAGCLVWVFHDVHPRPMIEAARQLGWRWVALGMVVDAWSYFLQGLRWKLLLRPVGRISWPHAAQAIYAGLFTNEVLPMRAGEVVRAYVAARRLQAPVSAVFPSVVVERLFDGVWLAVGVGVTAALLPLPHSFRLAGDVLGVLIVGAAALFLYEVLRVPPPPRDSHHAALHPPHWLTRFRRGFQQIGRRRGTLPRPRGLPRGPLWPGARLLAGDARLRLDSASGRAPRSWSSSPSARRSRTPRPTSAPTSLHASSA